MQLVWSFGHSECNRHGVLAVLSAIGLKLFTGIERPGQTGKTLI